MKTSKAATRYGEMFVAAADNCIGRSIVEYGEWSQSEIDLLEQIVQPGMTVLDIGANVGYHTLALAKAVGPTGKVISFEPQPAIFQLLAANIAINNLSNVTALNMALGEARSWIDMPPFSYDVANNFGALDIREFVRNEEAALSYTPISLQRLDDIVLARNAAVIKMDVEQMELSVLRGAVELLKRRRPAMLVENNLPGELSENLLKFLENIGYECYWQISLMYNSENYNKNNNNIFGLGGSPNVLAIPREALAKVEGMSKITDTSDHPLKRSA